MKRELVRRETHTFWSKGSNQTVADAAQLLAQLPNGWTLRSLTFEPGDGWLATAIGPQVSEALD